MQWLDGDTSVPEVTLKPENSLCRAGSKNVPTLGAPSIAGALGVNTEGLLPVGSTGWPPLLEALTRSSRRPRLILATMSMD